MLAVGIFSMLVGILLGMCFRVFILLPAMTLVCAVIAVFNVGGGDTYWWTAFVMLVATTALQAGYLVGATRALSAGVRAARLRTASRWGAARSTHVVISD
jgi:hypothetical protein